MRKLTHWQELEPPNQGGPWTLLEEREFPPLF